MKHSRSRSITSRRSYSRSPYRRSGRRTPNSRRPPSPPAISMSRKRSRYSADKRSVSRSKSPSYKKHTTSRRRYTRSRSRTRSGSRSRNSYIKSSRSNNRENPLPSRCIGIFGLSLYTTQPQIREIFSKYGPIERIQVVVDAQTGRSRGFCFIYYENLSDAKAACDNCCGMEIGGRRIRVAFSITERPHTPTPGVYMGQSARILRERYRAQKHHTKSRHSPEIYSKNHRSRYERSRSRSYSPRRYRY